MHILFLNRDGSLARATAVINDFTTNGPVLAKEDAFGGSVANMGDLDGNGYDDVMDWYDIKFRDEQKDEYWYDNGREYEGIFRYSYLIDENGTIERVYSKVKTKTHAKDILSDLD